MNILVIHQNFLGKHEGGGSRFNEMTKVWSSQGHKITVLGGMVSYTTGLKDIKYKNKYFYTEDEFYEGVTVIRCHVSERYNVSFIGRLWSYFSFVFSATYAGLFKIKGKYDVILVTSPPLFTGITAFIVSFFKKLPVVFEVRDLWPESAIDTGVLNNRYFIKSAYLLESYIYKKAKLINVLTPAFRTKLIQKGVRQDKIIYIPNAADFSMVEKFHTDGFDPEEYKRGLGLEDKFVITYIGVHGLANHLIQLIDAAALLVETRIVFQLIGSGAQKEMLQAEVKTRNLKNVIFRDAVPKADVFKYILASDVGASVLKKAEIFKTIYSNKTFDYMACKKPVLLAIDGVSRILIEEADCGFYVEPENSFLIAEKAKELLNLPTATLNKIGENGFLFAKKNFDREKLAKEYSSLIEKKIMRNE